MKLKQLSEEQLKELKEKANNRLSFIRSKLLINFPFIGNIAMNLNIVPTRDANNPTACTDGKTIWVDIAFLSELSEKECEFVLAHEIWHNVMMHFLRTGIRETNLFNIATDLEVNQLLASDGFDVPKQALWPNKTANNNSPYDFPNNLSAEEYYELLLKDMDQNKNKNKDSYDEDSENSNINSNKSSRSRTTKSRSNSSNIQGQFDKHSFSNDQDLDNRTDKYGEVNRDDDFNPNANPSENDLRNIAEEMREHIINSAQQLEKSRGTLPGHVSNIVNTILTPKIYWKDVLATFISSTVSNDSNWNIPNRRFVYNNLYLPSHAGESLKVVIGVDTSSSCANDFQIFLSEIYNITKTFSDYEIEVVQCDTEIKKIEKFDLNNPLNEDVIKSFEFKGLGGTILKPIFDHVSLNNEDANAIIMFTDGECEHFKSYEEPTIPTLWCISTKPSSRKKENFKNLEFGEMIFIED